MEEKDKYISQGTVLDMGFTKTMIKNLLPEPELKPNPHYRCAAPMKLWLESDVRSVMETDAYREALVKAEKRKASAHKAVETKKLDVQKLLEDLISSITVAKIDEKRLVDETLSEKNDWYEFLDSERGYFHGRVHRDSVDKGTLVRWQVNYVRHNLCNYDHNLYMLAGKIDKASNYRNLKNETLKKIAEVYPSLKEECYRQMV